jgi:hypothetical protein
MVLVQLSPVHEVTSQTSPEHFLLIDLPLLKLVPGEDMGVCN